MAQSGALTDRSRAWPLSRRVAVLRVAIVFALLAAWEALAASGLVFREVVPSLATIARALGAMLADAATYGHLLVTTGEIAAGLAIGATLGLAVGILLGANPFLGKAYASFLFYLGPTPKIIFFPVMIMWFGVGSGSKVAMGALSCFFPVAISAMGGVRQIDRVLLRVGRSFRASAWQMVSKIYLPAMRAAVVNGIRLGLGIAIIGTLLAETKLASRGIGYLIIQAYATFDMPRLYALLLVTFAFAIAANAVVSRFAGAGSARLPEIGR